MTATSNYQHSNSTLHREATDQKPVITKLSLNTKAKNIKIPISSRQKFFSVGLSHPPTVRKFQFIIKLPFRINFLAFETFNSSNGLFFTNVTVFPNFSLKQKASLLDFSQESVASGSILKRWECKLAHCYKDVSLFLDTINIPYKNNL